MKSLSLPFAILLATACSSSVTADEYKLTTTKDGPVGLSKEISAGLSSEGFRIEGPDGPVCDVWLLKELSVKAKFSPTLSVNYPFAPGQLVGALRVPEKTIYTDFRGQELKGGVYTLRYGQQPEDGNHIGSSETADFLLALPGKIDTDTKPISAFDPLSAKSARSAGSTHPAIYSLLPTEDPIEKTSLTHDEDYELWILNVSAAAKAGDKSVKVPVRLVLVGKSEA